MAAETDPALATIETPSYLLALALAALAGWVDVIGFIKWGGLFVSFMSGNSTTISAAAAASDWPTVRMMGLILGCFVGGVIAGEALSLGRGRRGGALVLLVEGLILAVAFFLAVDDPRTTATALLLALAMGLQNASVHQAGGVSLAITYVTGTLVQAGRRIAAALTGRGKWTAALPYAGLWLCFIAGGFASGVSGDPESTGPIAAAALAAFFFAAILAAPPDRDESGPA